MEHFDENGKRRERGGDMSSRTSNRDYGQERAPCMHRARHFNFVQVLEMFVYTFFGVPIVFVRIAYERMY